MAHHVVDVAEEPVAQIDAEAEEEPVDFQALLQKLQLPGLFGGFQDLPVDGLEHQRHHHKDGGLVFFQI